LGRTRPRAAAARLIAARPGWPSYPSRTVVADSLFAVPISYANWDATGVEGRDVEWLEGDPNSFRSRPGSIDVRRLAVRRHVRTQADLVAAELLAGWRGAAQPVAGFVFHDAYLGPASELKASMLRVPQTFRLTRGNIMSIPGWYRDLREWTVRVGDLECGMSFGQLLDPVDQEVFANLDRQQAREVKAGQLVVVEVSTACGNH